MKDTQTEYHTTNQGMRFGTSVGSGQSLGNHAHEQLIDDPTNPKGTDSEISIEDSIEWIDGIMSTRWVNSNDRRRIVVMQRLAERDMSGHLLASGTYEHLKIPMEYEGDKRKTSIGWSDPRTKPGELMCEARINRESVDAMKIVLGSYGTAGQYQQRPSPEGGGIIKRDWFKRWTQATLPPRFEHMEVTVDANFKEGKKSDNAAVGVWGNIGPQSFLIDMIPPRAMSYVLLHESLRELQTKIHARRRFAHAIRATNRSRHERARAHQRTLTEIPGVVPFKPSEYGSKVARAEAASPQIEAGNVWVPAAAPWVEGYLHEMETFPNGAHDDQVDMTTTTTSSKAARMYVYAGEASDDRLPFPRRRIPAITSLARRYYGSFRAKQTSRILDYRGAPIETSLLTQELSAGSNVTGVRPVFRQPASFSLTPEKLASILRQVDQGNIIEYLTMAEEMVERDLHYSSELGIR